MSALHDAASGMARRPPLPLLASERLFAIERAAARLEIRKIGEGIAIVSDPDELEEADAAGVRRLLRSIWPDPRWNRAAARLVARGRDIGTPSLDRAIILAYLRHYPVAHPAFDALRTAADAAAAAHDWPWAARGRQWSLWSAEGPALVRAAIAAGRIEDRGLLRILAASAFLAAGDA